MKTLNIQPIKEALLLLLFLFSLSSFSNRIARHSIHANDNVKTASFLKESKAIVIASQSFVKNVVFNTLCKNKVLGFIPPLLKTHLENKQRSSYIISFIKRSAYTKPPSSMAVYYHLFSLKEDDFLF